MPSRRSGHKIASIFRQTPHLVHSPGAERARSHPLQNLDAKPLGISAASTLGSMRGQCREHSPASNRGGEPARFRRLAEPRASQRIRAGRLLNLDRRCSGRQSQSWRALRLPERIFKPIAEGNKEIAKTVNCGSSDRSRALVAQRPVERRPGCKGARSTIVRI